MACLGVSALLGVRVLSDQLVWIMWSVKRTLGVLMVHRKSLSKCLNYEPRFLAGCELGAWLQMSGIGYETLCNGVRCNISRVLSGGGTPELIRDLDAM